MYKQLFDNNESDKILLKDLLTFLTNCSASGFDLNYQKVVRICKGRALYDEKLLIRSLKVLHLSTTPGTIEKQKQYIFEVFKSKKRYNETLIRRSILVIRNSTSHRTIERHKLFIIDALSPIIIKNVNNFFNLLKDLESHQILHEKDDIVAECYIILDKCIQNYCIDPSDKRYRDDSKFYWYCNKSFSIGLFRLKGKVYQMKGYNSVDFSDINLHNREGFSHTMVHPLLLGKNFSDKEILLMQSKIEDEKIQDFCKKIDISRTEYYKVLKSIKAKVNKQYLK